MNQLPWQKRVVLKKLLASGASLRRTAAEVGCSTQTVIRYSKMWKFSVTCGCGQPSGHNGWCKTRLDFSPNRRGWLAEHWGKRGSSHVAESVDRAVAESKALGHDLGTFVWCSSGTPSIAYALCRTCGKAAKVNSGEGRRSGVDGTALREVCLTEEQRAAERAAKQEIKQWRIARKTLAEIQRRLRRPSSQTPASAPVPTSRA